MPAREPVAAESPVMTVGNAIYALYSVAKSCDPNATWQKVADQLTVSSGNKSRNLVRLGDTLKNRTWKDEDAEKTSWPGGNISRDQYIDFACGLVVSPFYQNEQDVEQARRTCAERNARLPLDASPANIARPSGVKDWAVLAEQLAADLASESLRSSNSTHGKFNGLTPGVIASLEPLKTAGWELKRFLGTASARTGLPNNATKAEKLPVNVRETTTALRTRIVEQDITCGILLQKLFGVIYDEAESDRAAKQRRHQDRMRNDARGAEANREDHDFLNKKKMLASNLNMQQFNEGKPLAPNTLPTALDQNGAKPLRVADLVAYLQQNPGVSPQQCAGITESLLAEDGVYNEGPQTLIDLYETLVAHGAPGPTILLVSKRSALFYPENPRVRAMRIRALAACGRINQARAEVEACLETDSRYWPEDLFVTVLTFVINQGLNSQTDVERALDLSDRFIEVHHDDEHAYELRAHILIGANRKAEATALLRDVILGVDAETDTGTDAGADGADPTWGTFSAPRCALLYLDGCVRTRLDAATCVDALEVAKRTRIFTDPAELRANRSKLMKHLMYCEAQARYRLICQGAQPPEYDSRTFLNETIAHYASALRLFDEGDPGRDELLGQDEDLRIRQGTNET